MFRRPEDAGSKRSWQKGPIEGTTPHSLSKICTDRGNSSAQQPPPSHFFSPTLGARPKSKLILQLFGIHNAPAFLEPVTKTLHSVPTSDITFCASRRSVIE